MPWPSNIFISPESRVATRSRQYPGNLSNGRYASFSPGAGIPVSVPGIRCSCNPFRECNRAFAGALSLYASSRLGLRP
ncbi:hypothetical protein SAMN04487894_103385 [Niabella drilacis]|uniref:Uncharacterized protein n=1 Tax=Niabella drilacis (strain DSM 25811 / CCM 8410 / CCUG 62505 / LMG 26954 / E90) TaxID=1285928 RepID=A0A1G6NSR3_NIADE|nr:hypothetical protein SAMN04487894_103385 [Niabella drilacis]